MVPFDVLVADVTVIEEASRECEQQDDAERTSQHARISANGRECAAANDGRACGLSDSTACQFFKLMMGRAVHDASLDSKLSMADVYQLVRGCWDQNSVDKNVLLKFVTESRSRPLLEMVGVFQG